MFWQLGRELATPARLPIAKVSFCFSFLVSDETEASACLDPVTSRSRAHDHIPSCSACRPLTGADLGLRFWKFRWGR